MLKVQEIREIIKLIDQSDIQEFVYEFEGSKIKMKKGSNITQVIQSNPVLVEQPIQVPLAPVPSNAVNQGTMAPTQESVQNVESSDTSHLHKITSPMVGTFYKSSSPDSGAYVKVGSDVQAETIVCIVEAMKLFNEIEAEVEGEIVEILVQDGQLVEYGQPLFLVKAR